GFQVILPRGACCAIGFVEHAIQASRQQRGGIGEGAGGVRIRWFCLRIRSEEHTSELQSRENLVCRLLLEKKKKTTNKRTQLHLPSSLALPVPLLLFFH